MKKVLIANRGEIAIRIARTCSDLGIKTVGIYSEDDANCLHLSKVDEAYPIQGKGAQAYLDIKQIISIANKAINDAINLLSDKVPLMDNLVEALIVNESLESEYLINSLNSYLSRN